MLIKNIGFESVEWLVEHGKVISLRRSQENYIPPEIARSLFTFAYEEWIKWTTETGEILDSPFILSAPKGYDVEVAAIDETFPEEILERLGIYRVIEDRDSKLF